MRPLVRGHEILIDERFAAGDLEPDDAHVAEQVEQAELVRQCQPGEGSLLEVAVFAGEVAAADGSCMAAGWPARAAMNLLSCGLTMASYIGSSSGLEHR